MLDDLDHEFHRAIRTAIARGLRPGPWRSEIERRFIVARSSGDSAECREILMEWRARIGTAEAEQQAAGESGHDATISRITPREIVEAVERGGWRRLTLREDGAIMIAGGPPADSMLTLAVQDHANAIRKLLRERERREVLIPAAL